MDGVSTRFAFKILAATYNHDTSELGADPVHLMYALEQSIRASSFPRKSRNAISNSSRPSWCRAMRIHRPRDPESLSGILFGLRPEPVRPLRRLCRRLDRGSGLQGSRHRPTAQPELLNQELTKIEKPAGIANTQGLPQRGRQVFAASRAQHGGKNPSWTSYEKIREVIEKRIFSQVEDLLPVISFGSKKDGDTEKKHGEFVQRMVERGLPNVRFAGWFGMVHAGETSRLRRKQRWPCTSLIRRLNPGSKSLENRQRFLRRAKALVQGAVKKTSQDRDIKDVLEGGEVAYRSTA